MLMKKVCHFPLDCFAAVCCMFKCKKAHNLWWFRKSLPSPKHLPFPLEAKHVSSIAASSSFKLQTPSSKCPWTKMQLLKHLLWHSLHELPPIPYVLQFAHSFWSLDKWNVGFISVCLLLRTNLKLQRTTGWAPQVEDRTYLQVMTLDWISSCSHGIILAHKSSKNQAVQEPTTPAGHTARHTLAQLICFSKRISDGEIYHTDTLLCMAPNLSKLLEPAVSVFGSIWII